MKPLIIVNFKAYTEGLGERGLNLINLLSKHDNVLMSVPAPLIGLASSQFCDKESCNVKPRVLAQHVDNVKPGAHTGSVTIDEVQMAGAIGSLVNHSEKRLTINDIKVIVKELKSKKLMTIICCQNLSEARQFKRLKPDYIAYEPPELIGGNVSVSSSKPEVIEEIVQEVKPVKVLVGAGVKDKNDIQKSLELGAKGVLIASGVIKESLRKVEELIN